MLATLFSQEGTTLQGLNLRKLDMFVILSLAHTHTHTHKTMSKLIQKLILTCQIYEMLPVIVCIALFQKFKMIVS